MAEQQIYSRRPFKHEDPLEDEDYVRRLKMANYGRWFLKPETFTNKVQLLNGELD